MDLSQERQRIAKALWSHIRGLSVENVRNYPAAARAIDAGADPADVARAMAAVSYEATFNGLFGAALATSDFSNAGGDDPGPPHIWIGSPGEGLGTQQQAGDVTVLTWIPGDCCPPSDTTVFTYTLGPFTLLRQGTGGGLGGAYETGDHVGASLASLGSFNRGEADYGTGVLVGDPGENLGTVHNAGAVIELTDRTRGARYIRHTGGDVAELHYGTVLTVEGPGPT